MEKKIPKLSVIVPVYNTAMYLEKCLDSLLNQSYSNMEIIVVEDKSTDNSRDKLKKYKNKKNIKIFYNEINSGLSYSRNKGLDMASGDFIGYIDSDDYIEKDYYYNMMNSIINDNATLAISDVKVVLENENNKEIIELSRNEDSKLGYINVGLAASACNKVFKKELISKYKFAEGKVNEDLAVIIPTIVNAFKITYVKNNYYYYIQRNNSIQNSRFSFKRFDIFYGVDLTLERIKDCENYQKIKDAIIFNQIIVLLLYVIPKEKNFFRRYKILKKYSELSRKYKINQNYYMKELINKSGKKHKIYYYLLINLIQYKMIFLANLLILSYHIAINIIGNEKVIKKIDQRDLINAALKQKKLKDEIIKISVVIPNYNYANFLEERIYSILNQNYKIYELIILDDCSKDDSLKKIKELETMLKDYIKIKVIENKKNSGTAFKQWQLGFNNASGDYVWIAEADDYCNKNLLKELIKPILKNRNIYISYADTAFVDAIGRILVKTIKYEIDAQKSRHWDKTYVNNGMEEIKKYSYLNCTIANVSSAIIKNENYDNLLEESCKLKQAGDWLFYLKLMQKGDVAFSKKVLNYYRVHGNNVSSTMDHARHIDEIKYIYNYLDKNIVLSNKQKEMMQKRIEFLKERWKII